MANTHGSLSINSDNIFPIIKKWLYSDHDIFYRELISNGCDAITKLSQELRHSLRSTRTRLTRIRLSDISDLVSIRHSWLLTVSQ